MLDITCSYFLWLEKCSEIYVQPILDCSICLDCCLCDTLWDLYLTRLQHLYLFIKFQSIRQNSSFFLLVLFALMTQPFPSPGKITDSHLIRKMKTSSHAKPLHKMHPHNVSDLTNEMVASFVQNKVIVQTVKSPVSYTNIFHHFNHLSITWIHEQLMFTAEVGTLRLEGHNQPFCRPCPACVR